MKTMVATPLTARFKNVVGQSVPAAKVSATVPVDMGSAGEKSAPNKRLARESTVARRPGSMQDPRPTTLSKQPLNSKPRLFSLVSLLFASFLALPARVNAVEDPPGCSYPNGAGNTSQGGINFNLAQAHVGDTVPVFPSLGMASNACRAINATGTVYIATGLLTNFLVNVTLNSNTLVACPSDSLCQPGPYNITITTNLVGASVDYPNGTYAGAPKTVRAVEYGVGTVLTGEPTEQLADMHTASIQIVTPCLQVSTTYDLPAGTNCFTTNVTFRGYVTNCGDITLTNVTVSDSRVGTIQLFNPTNGAALTGNVSLATSAYAVFTNSFAPTNQETCAGYATNVTTATARDTTAIDSPRAFVTNSVATITPVCVPPSSAGVYTVEVTGAIGTVTNSATLTITNALTVQFLTPANNQLFVTSPTNILLWATNTTGSLTSMAFLQGTNTLGVVSAPPYQLLLTNVGPGTYTLTAKGNNASGCWAATDITIFVNAVPVITNNSPTNIATFTEVAHVAHVGLTNTAWDPDTPFGSITNVTFYTWNATNAHVELIGTGATNGLKYSLTWSNRTVGYHEYFAVATDNLGASNPSPIGVFKVNPTNPQPVIWIAYPSNNATFRAGADITIAAATNGIGTVTNVEFYSNGRLLGNDPDPPFSMAVCCWEPGKYGLMAMATDNLGSVRVSTNVEILINEESPTSDGFWDPLFVNVGPGDTIYSLAVAPNGDVLAGGNIRLIYQTITNDWESAYGVIRWDGTNWSQMGSRIVSYLLGNPPFGPFAGDGVLAIASQATNLFIGGGFTGMGYDPVQPLRYVAKWNGSDWQQAGQNILSYPDYPQKCNVRSLAVLGEDLYIGGNFTQAGDDTDVQYIARLDRVSDTWVPVGNSLNGPVNAMAVIGGQLYIGGSFTNAGGNTNANYVARLSGSCWTNLDSGVSGTNVVVWAMAACGTNLYVGGAFSNVGEVTNANNIAVWNQVRWHDLGGGVVTYLPPGMLPGVYSIAARGKHLLVGGCFTNALNATNTLDAYNVLQATWSEASQTWTWTGLDRGVDWPDGVTGDTFSAVYRLLLLEGDTPNAYDLLVGGAFWRAGQTLMTQREIARWRVGQPLPAGIPTVTIINPANAAVFTNDVPMTVSTTAAVSSYTNMDHVDFWVDGGFVTSVADPSTNVYTTDLPDLAVGTHLLKVSATDASGLFGESRPVVLTVRATNNPVAASNDVFTLAASSPAQALSVLANDTGSNGPLRIKELVQLNQNLGRASLGHDRTYLTYSPFAHTFGTDRFYYTVTNLSGGSDSAWVTVNIRPRPSIEITNLNDGMGFRTNTTVTIGGTSHGWDGNVTNVALSVNGAPYKSLLPDATGNFITNWTGSQIGFYTFEAVATDTNGVTNVSAPVTIVLTNTVAAVLPNAVIANLSGTPYWQSGLAAVDLPKIREGIFDLMGTATGNAPFGYQVLLFRPQDWEPAGDLSELLQFGFDPFANVTPAGTTNYQGFLTTPVTDASLGKLDLTAIPNGVYDLVLRVRGGTAESNAIVRVQLESNLKIGQFSFSEQDVTIPVNGIPLTVVRSYNSLNTTGEAGRDFGVGWSFALNSLDIVMDEARVPATAIETLEGTEDPGDINALNFSLRVGGGRDLTLTLPDGNRTTFRQVFTNTTAAEHCASCLDAVWLAPPGVTATLTTPNPATRTSAGDNTVVAVSANLGPYWQAAGPSTPFEAYDVPKWILKTPDGTQYEITRDAPGADPPTFLYLDAAGDFGTAYRPYYIKPHPGQPKLTKIIQRSGDEIRISNTDIAHYTNSTSSVPTRSVWIERDLAGRISAIYDPNSGVTNNPPIQSSIHPVLRYIYNRDTGNLIQVHRLQDRAAGNYLVTKYHYDHPNFPHYITSIEDPRGIPVARNLYDDAGRLIGVIDSAGRTNRFEHDITGRREIHYDRSGNATTYEFDTQGNVTAVVDALNHTNRFVYDENGFLTNSVNALGHVTVYTNNPYGNPLSVTVPYPAGADPAAYTTRFTYNTNGEQTSVVLPSGGIITNQFDPNTGLLLAVRDGNSNLISQTIYNAAGLPAVEADKFGSLKYTYDSAGNLTFMTNSLNKVTRSGYDANGNLTTLTEGTNTSTVAYDAMNRETVTDYGHNIALTNTYVDGGDWSSVDGPTIGHMERKMDDQGRLAGWETANGSEPGFAYDVNGRLEFETNSIGVVTRSVYNEVGWLIASTNLATGAGTTYAYDAAGQRTVVTNALGFTTRYAYYPSGSLKAMTNAFGTNYSGTNYWLYSDAAGACAACGNAVSVTDPFGRVTESIASPYGLPVSTVWRFGSLVSSNFTEYLSGLTTEEQEAQEYPAAITDEGGRTRRYEYTDLGQLYRATDLSGAAWWTNQFDTNSGALLAVISPTAETNRYVYDDLDNLKALGFGDQNWLTNFYNAENRLSGVRLPTGVAVTNLYDFAGRLTNRSSTLGETASFEYNGNDAVTKLTDNTGSTTNLHDAAGRLWGIDYPSGASVRYELDKLDRITAITNKATAAGTNYVTRYQYDPVGNVTNVVDPFNGNTRFEYDAVGRRTKRTLPNNVVTEWHYDWRDRVTNITHKIGSTNLASVLYERLPGGEPSKITREDGSYVELKYDSALRLTNEVYYTNTVAQTTNSYAYDASGSRIKLVKGGLAYTNTVSGGYRITEVKTNGVVVESYSYDNGGRVTTITRDGVTNNLGYNSADQVAAVTNGAAWVTYQHDASGRRTASTNYNGTTSVRKFLVAPTPGTDLESPHLIANASGSVQQGYVYLGDDPIMRFETTGSASRVYYLEDGMGSVIGLAPDSSPSTANTTRLFYDGFGNARATNGPAPTIPSGTGGDFRFHGAWLEESSGLYNMRAREYDPRMGRFTSRDPDAGSFRMSESLHPYGYAHANPEIYSDPGGKFSLIEISFAGLLQSGEKVIRGVAAQAVKARVRRQVQKFVTDAFRKEIKNLVSARLKGFLGPLEFGTEFETRIKKKFRKLFCEELSIPESIYLEVPIDRYGDPQGNGLNCDVEDVDLPAGAAAYAQLGVPRPDFVLSSRPPKLGANRFAKAWLVGEIKSSTKTFYNDYLNRGKPDQFDAIMHYAKKRTIPKTALFVVAYNDTQKSIKTIQAEVSAQGIKKGAIALMIIVLGK